MANKKISDLSAATIPLDGTEVMELESDTGISGKCTTQDLIDLGNPMTDAGDVIIGGTDGAPTRLAQGNDGYRLGVEDGVTGFYPMYSVQTVTSATTVTPLVNNDKIVISAQAAALTIANPSGTASEGQGFVIALKDNGTSRAISFGTSYRAMGATLPTATTISKWIYIPVQYNATDSKWDVFASSVQA